MILSDGMAAESDQGGHFDPSMQPHLTSDPTKDLLDMFSNHDTLATLGYVYIYGKGDQRDIARIFVDAAVTCLKKNSDYGSSVFKAPAFAPECSAAAAIRVRMSDKFERITNLLKLEQDGKGPEIAESLEDTVMDLGVYCFLWLVARRRENHQI